MNYLEIIANRIRRHAPTNGMTNRDDAHLFLIYAAVLLAKGESVTAEDVHNAWVAWMTPLDPSHDSLMPFADLAPQAKDEDGPFVEALRATAQELGL